LKFFNTRKKKAAAVMLGLVAGTTLLTACGPGTSDAEMANKNMTTAADNFEVTRHIVGINGITDKYLFEVVGKCSIKDQGNQLEVLCKEANNQYKKYMMGISDNVTYMVTPLDNTDVSVTHTRVIFKPETLIPEIELSLGKK
jgi:hypothetical protein